MSVCASNHEGEKDAELWGSAHSRPWVRVGGGGGGGIMKRVGQQQQQQQRMYI